MSKRYIEIIHYDTGEVFNKIEVTGKSDRVIEKIDDGINRNLNHDRFYTRIT